MGSHDAMQADAARMRMNDFLENAPVWLKALAAAAAGRSLLLLQARRDVPLTLRNLLTAILYEAPLIAAFALLGWHVAAVLGSEHESTRIVLTVMLANLGARGIDRLISRVLPAEEDRTK